MLGEGFESAEKNQAENTTEKQKKKFNRHKMVDANRLRSNSLGDASRLTQVTLPFEFGKSVIGAVKNSTMTETLGAGVSMEGEPMIASQEPIAFSGPDNAHSDNPIAGTLPSAAGANSNANNDLHGKNEKNNTTHSHGSHIVDDDALQSTPTTVERTATLSDVKQTLNSNRAVIDAMENSNKNNSFRPHLNAASTPNGGAAKKRRRGGKKYKEMMAKRAEREKNGQNNTNVHNPVNANLQSQNATTRNPTQRCPNQNATAHALRKDLNGPNSAKRGRVTGGTPPEVIQKNKCDHKTQTRQQYPMLIERWLIPLKRRT